MDFAPGEQDAIAAHASALGLPPDEYIRRTVADRALQWQREREAFHALAQRKGCTVEELVRHGSFTHTDL
ncbi:hypothetical protein V2J94_40150 [Streptomyces sp. DSM 41524]|uniref:Uncharacterized protein n=1 Tax=Streptomyces asiaticus subsp. ignotus TaxID=3098222 RepID=A0ABU7Q9E5_9ACTN|nr:hypothetical protein [Streptomyces sp. DSM 41524]